MQVNRVNQFNQQTSFTSAYTKYLNTWQAYVKKPGGYKIVGTLPLNCLKAIFKDAKPRIGLLLNDNCAKFNMGGLRDRPVGNLPVALTQVEAQEFLRLTELAEKIKYLNRLFAEDYEFSQELKIVTVDDDKFIDLLA